MKPSPQPAPAKSSAPAQPKRRRWLLPLLLLLVSAAVFWGLPLWQPAGPVKVEFQNDTP
ncbi:MAG: hypothetical protein KF812_11320 [Fimbriimonadaceae bacterium]|nr:hypothetical protein [Fimbriimonadaceae bacterium]